MPISIILPTYTAVDYLQLCLESIYQNQHDPTNEVVIIVDGTFDLNKHIIDDFKTKLNVKLINFEENVGLALASNYGFYNASNRLCLNINDDNVLPYHFDKILLEQYSPKTMVVPNQIEPRSSMFKSFIIRNFGEDVKEFDLKIFTTEEQKLRSDSMSIDGWTFPFFIDKFDFIKVGGFDPYYNSSHVIDWDLFLKLQMSGIGSVRIHSCNFYHFGSKSARTTDSYEKEKLAHEYSKLKWGSHIQHDVNTNLKYINGT